MKFAVLTAAVLCIVAANSLDPTVTVETTWACDPIIPADNVTTESLLGTWYLISSVPQPVMRQHYAQRCPGIVLTTPANETTNKLLKAGFEDVLATDADYTNTTVTVISPSLWYETDIGVVSQVILLHDSTLVLSSCVTMLHYQWTGVFLRQHKNVSNEEMEDIWDRMQAAGISGIDRTGSGDHMYCAALS